MVPITAYTDDVKARITRGQLSHGDIQTAVDDIIMNVRQFGDRALFEYTQKFDKHALTADNIKVSREEIAQAYAAVEPELIKTIQKAIGRITDFHLKQKRHGWLDTSANGEIMGQIIRPLENVGIYVPGGKAAYPSSVIMNAVPAKVAGVTNIVMTTPAGSDGKINPAAIVAAAETGIDRIYKIGGAQAVAALAFSTESVARVDKIVGPGNIYVALAKRSVYGHVDIDSVAGPSEILIVADETANPAFVAADMLSQAEHDELASAILVTDSKRLAELVQTELSRQTERLERRQIIEASLAGHGAIVVVGTMEEAMAVSNQVAPEHLEICVLEPFSLLPLVQNAGAVFLGNYSPEPLGDYMAGPNHVIPTGGTARFFSQLSVDDFIKKSSVLSFSRSALSELADDIIRFAGAEGLTAHANAIKVRETRYEEIY